MAEVCPLSENEAALAALASVEVLYTDLDGTMLARGGCVLADAGGQPSTRVAEAIVALNRAGLRVVPVSGRTRMQLTELARLMGWRDFIAEAGCVRVDDVGLPSARVIYDTGEWPDGTADGSTPYELIRDVGSIDALQRTFPAQVEYHTPWHLNREGSHLLRGCLDLVDAQAVLDTLDLPIGILDNGIVHPREHGLACFDAPIHAYHLVPKGVTKAETIAADLAERGLATDQAASVGDSVTDLEMARSTGLMVLVRNAFESPTVHAALEAGHYRNVVAACCPRSDGWAELADAWLKARAVG
jgi:hydroxymethylpyrimidine pyrophosphatase-like HAD family hydrolase